MTGIIGKKLGMSQIFDETGKLITVTYVICEPNEIVQEKTEEKDGINGVVLGFDKLKKERKTKKYRVLKQLNKMEGKKGDEIKVDVFKEGDEVYVTGTSKGKGFQGPVRRHNFKVARLTHGTKEPRHGSTGACAMPGRTKPGLKMAGHMGSEKVTLRGRKIIKIDPKKNLIAVQGPIPGAKDSIVVLKK